MSGHLLISIIIPCYNGGRNILECIHSIEESTYKKFEIIIVDDASKDNSVKLIKEYMNTSISDIKLYIQPENHRCGGARNLGTEMAVGDYIMYVDQDDTIINTLLEDMVNATENGSIDCVSCDIREGHGRTCSRVKLGRCVPLNKEDRVELMAHHGYSFGILIRRALLIKYRIRFPEDCMFEDVLYPNILFMNVSSYCHIPIAGYTRKFDDNSQTAYFNLRKLDDRCKAVKWYYNKLQEYDGWEAFKELAEWQYVYYCYTSNVRMMLHNRKLYNAGRISQYVNYIQNVENIWDVIERYEYRFQKYEIKALRHIYINPKVAWLYLILFKLRKIILSGRYC